MYEQILWYMFVPSGVIYVALILLTFIGGDIDVEVDLDDGIGTDDIIGLFTIRNAVYFIFGYSGGGLIGITNGYSLLTSTIIGLSVGVILVLITTLLMFVMLKCNQINIPSYDGLVGKSAKVYLRINPTTNGKITVNVNGTQKEMYASSEIEILSGTTVRIISIDNGIAVVEQI